MSKPLRVCDANIAIRLLRWDHDTCSPIARKLFERAESGEFTLYFTSGCVAEITWVLTSYYEQDRKEVAFVLMELFRRPGIRLEHPQVTLAALKDLTTKPVDFLDAFHARLALEKGHEVVSFDRDFKKWPELGWKRPE